MERLGTAAGFGAVSGMRSMMGLALVSRDLSDRHRLSRSATQLERWLAEDLVAVTLSALAIGELVADKLPATPPRTELPSLLARAAAGGVLGAIAAGRDDRVAGAAVGVLAALAASYGGFLLRRAVGRATLLPDAALALAEDAMAIAAARELTREL